MAFLSFFFLSPLYILLTYLGIGIRKGMVHLVWNLGWYSRTELTIPTPTVKINDGNWHMLKVDRVRQSLDVEIDGEVYNSRVTGSYYELNTANSVLLGKKSPQKYFFFVRKNSGKSDVKFLITKLF